MQNLLEFEPSVICDKYIFSHNPVDTLSFDNISFEADFAQEIIFGGKRSGVVYIFTMDVDLG